MRRLNLVGQMGRDRDEAHLFRLAVKLLRFEIVESLLNYFSDVSNQQTNSVVVYTKSPALSPFIDHVLESVDKEPVLLCAGSYERK